LYEEDGIAFDDERADAQNGTGRIAAVIWI
jgi:hypothetical protein